MYVLAFFHTVFWCTHKLLPFLTWVSFVRMVSTMVEATLTKAPPDCPRCESELEEEEVQVGQEEVGAYYCWHCHISYDPIGFANFDDRED